MAGYWSQQGGNSVWVDTTSRQSVPVVAARPSAERASNTTVSALPVSTRSVRNSSSSGSSNYQQMLNRAFQREQFKFEQTKYSQQRKDEAERLRLASGTISSGYGEMLTAWAQNSGQQAADIRSGYQAQEAAGMQALARTGMANTTIAPTMRTGYEREKQASLNRNADANLRTQLGILEGRTSALTGVQTQYAQG